MSDQNTATLISCVEKINNHLIEEERDLAWLCRKTDIPYGTLYATFKEKRIPLNQERLNLINIACKTDFQLDVVEEK